MRRVAGAVAAVLVGLAVAGVPAQAAERAWCARAGGDDDLFVNCGFDSFEQCRAYISGLGGFCEPNPALVRPPQRRKPPQPAARPDRAR